MSKPVIEVVDPGLLSTIQDVGRYGYQKFGVPVAGAMDTFALRAANALLCNDDNAAGIEMTVLGPRIRFLADTWIALTGADLTPVLENEPVEMWQAIPVKSGSVLSYRGVSDGMRGYLAVAGGIDVPLVMGSRSTYMKAQLGGLDGRALKAGDRLSALAYDADLSFGMWPQSVERPVYGHSHEVLVVLGPQNDAFTEAGIAAFLGSEYIVSMQSDRMGYRLEGPTIEHVTGADIISDGTPLGAVQIPGSGQPIILLADRGITGGYTKIATVIGPDISKLAQAMPGDSLTFKSVSVDEAHDILREQEDLLDSIRHQNTRLEESGIFSIVVNGEAFEIADESGEPISPGVLASSDSKSWTRQATATIGGYTYEFEVKVQRLD